MRKLIVQISIKDLGWWLDSLILNELAHYYRVKSEGKELAILDQDRRFMIDGL